MSSGNRSELADSMDLLVYGLFLPAIVFLGPLEAFGGLLLYWLLRPEADA